MDTQQTKFNSGSITFLLATGLMYLVLGLLALSPIAVIWLAADWLHELFRQSSSFFSNNPRLYTVMTIIAVSAAITLIADKLYHRVKQQQKRQFERI